MSTRSKDINRMALALSASPRRAGGGGARSDRAAHAASPGPGQARRRRRGARASAPGEAPPGGQLPSHLLRGRRRRPLPALFTNRALRATETPLLFQPPRPCQAGGGAARRDRASGGAELEPRPRARAGCWLPGRRPLPLHCPGFHRTSDPRWNLGHHHNTYVRECSGLSEVTHVVTPNKRTLVGTTVGDSSSAFYRISPWSNFSPQPGGFPFLAIARYR